MNAQIEFLRRQLDVEQEQIGEWSQDDFRDHPESWTQIGDPPWMFEGTHDGFMANPALALRQVAAKRAILDRCELEMAEGSGVTSGAALGETVITLLVQPYRGRPGWQEEWGQT